MAHDWLRDEIGTGLQKLFALRLPGSPPADAIIGTATVWLEAMEHIHWVESLDRARIQQAFRVLLRTCDRWPAPRLFLDSLGSRAPPRKQDALPIPPDVRERNRAKLRDIASQLANSMQMNKTNEQRRNQ